MANLMLSVLGAVARFKRGLRERQRGGIALAKQRGAYTEPKKARRIYRDVATPGPRRPR